MSFRRDDEDDMSFGRQILPVANLPADFDQEPEDGMQYLFTVRRDARNLPHVTRVANPYETPERPPPPPSDILPAVHPALPSPEWLTSFEAHYRNFRKNVAQSTTHVHKVDVRKPFPDLIERDLWWSFLAGRPPPEWDGSMKSKQKFQRGMRAFADEPEPETGSSRSMYEDDDSKLPVRSDAPAPLERDGELVEHSEDMPTYKPREPTPSLLRLVDQRMAFHLLMYFTHWTNLHLRPDKPCRVTQTHARWIFALLSRIEDFVSADDMHLLRNLARAYLSMLRELSGSTAYLLEDDVTPGSCWLIISVVVSIWGQRDLWTDAEEIIRGP